MNVGIKLKHLDLAFPAWKVDTRFEDDGANVSVIYREFADSLGLQDKRESLELQWLNDKRIREESKLVNVSISETANNAQRFDINSLFL